MRLLTLFFAAALAFQDTKVQEGVRVPCRISDANHISVRAKVNGKGPYNFIVDTGAPALFLAVKIAENIGIKPDEKDKKWGKVEKFELEGGLVVENVKVRLEDPFQLQGMASLGMNVDGIIGYNVLAQYKIDFDGSRRYMIWTKQQGYEPPGIMTAKELYGDNPPPANNNEADGMGQMAKMMAALMGPGKGKSEPRGYIGIEVDKVDASDIVITAVHEKSPAAEAGLKKDDVILEVGGRKVRTLAGLLNKTFSPGDEVTFKVKRGDEEKELTVKVGRGL